MTRRGAGEEEPDGGIGGIANVRRKGVGWKRRGQKTTRGNEHGEMWFRRDVVSETGTRGEADGVVY
jgi:hypothetical protein